MTISLLSLLLVIVVVVVVVVVVVFIFLLLVVVGVDVRHTLRGASQGEHRGAGNHRAAADLDISFSFVVVFF